MDLLPEKSKTLNSPLLRSCGVKQYCFTLIELLVVIAIIAILAGMLLPVLKSSQERGKSTSCMSSTQQCAVAFMNYAQDYEYMPLANFGFGDKKNGRPVDVLHTLRYFGYRTTNPMKYGCSVKRFAIVHTNLLEDQEDYSYSPFGSCYGYNAYFGQIKLDKEKKFEKINDLWGKMCYPVKPSMIKSPSNKITCGDYRTVDSTELRFIRYYDAWEQEYTGEWARAFYCHNKKANFSFADGHAASLEYYSVGKKFSNNSTEKTSTQYYLWPDYVGAKE